jgi:DNA polymerase I-like protein with 3'-5' exonuclease and polymerase domains
MKVVATLHPSYIQRGKWPLLRRLRNDLELALRESWFPEVRREPVEYVLSPTPAQAREVLRLGDPRPLYLDIETVMGTWEITVIGVAREPNRVICLPWLPPFKAMVAAILQDPGCRKVAHNLPFDLPILEADLGIQTQGPKVCTMQMHSVIAPDLEHALRKLAFDYYDGPPWKGEMKENLELYCCKDVDVMARSEVAMLKDLKEMGLEGTFDVAMKALDILIRARDWGVGIDLKQCKEVHDELDTQKGEAACLIKKLTAQVESRKRQFDALLAEALKLEKEAEPDLEVKGKIREAKKKVTRARKLKEKAELVLSPNVDSPPQLRKLLYEDLKLPVQRSKNSQGKYVITTDESALVELARRTQHPIVDALRRYRVAKSHMVHVGYDVPVVHPTWQPHGTGTGRLSCVEPNVQNIPKKADIAKRIRSIFTPVKPGWMLTSVDYSQIERRIQAVMSGDPVLLEAFAKGEDVHTKTAAMGLSLERGYEVTMEEVTPLDRYVYKSAVYLESYGGGWFKLQTELAKDGYYLTPKECKSLLAALKMAHPVLNKWRDGQVEKANRQRYLRNPFGRIREFLGPAFGNALNFVPQSTAADIILRAMIDIDPLLPPGEAIIVAQVHDELFVEHSPAVKDDVLGIMVEVMERGVSEMDGWHCPTDSKQGHNWAFA